MRKLYVWGMPAGTPRGPDSHVSGLARCRWEFGAEPRERPKAPVAYGLVSYVNSIRVLRKKRGRVGCKRAYFLFQHGRDNGKRGATLCLNYRFIGLHRRPPFFLFIFPSIIKHRTFQSFYPSTIPPSQFFSLFRHAIFLVGFGPRHLFLGRMVTLHANKREDSGSLPLPHLI